MWFVECPRCKGTGHVVLEGQTEASACPRCLGTGKIDVKQEYQKILEEDEEAQVQT